MGKHATFPARDALASRVRLHAEYHHCDKRDLTIHFTVPYQHATKFDVVVKIKNPSLFKTIALRVHGNTKPVLLYGTWHTYNTKIYGEVISSRQVVAL
jgi:hypothetical protein